jgi:excisionase family DNA binding protein
MAARSRPGVERLLTVAEVAELLGTSERFPRRLIAERRITFVHVGRHVRIPESAVRDFIAGGVGRASKCPLARRKGGGVVSSRRRFGKVRKLPSGRFQASFIAPSGKRQTALRTFRTKTDADRWLTTVEADLSRGAWLNEDLGRQTSATTPAAG